MQRGVFLGKKCPKCGGNVYLDIDEQDWYEECLQCSYTRFLDKIIDAKETVKAGKVPVATGNVKSN